MQFSIFGIYNQSTQHMKVRSALAIIPVSLLMILGGCKKDNNSPNTPKDPEFKVPVVKIAAGTFKMGTPKDDQEFKLDEKQHVVTLSRDFYMSACQITNAQFAEFLNEKGVKGDGKFATLSHGAQILVKSSRMGLTYKGDQWTVAAEYANHPVVFVSWYGADEYARWAGGSLPTEAQWEYACRAGSEKAFCFGDPDEEKLKEYAWFKESNLKDEMALHIHEVGKKKPNAWGLYDMHGNVWEWCADWYEAYKGTATEDPTGPTQGEKRVARGGSAFEPFLVNRSAKRGSERPDALLSDVGFRVVFPASSVQ